MWKERGETKYMMNVLHVPHLAKNLVSVGQIVEQGMQVKFNKSGCFIEKHGKLIARGKRQGRMFILDVNMPQMAAAMFTKGSNIISDVEMWHKRIGHISMQTLQNMLRKNVVNGLPKLNICEISKVCEACQYGKQNRLSFPLEGYRSKNLLDLIHTDVWGPTKNAFTGNCRFYVTFIDDYSRKTWIYFMKEKSDVFSCFC